MKDILELYQLFLERQHQANPTLGLGRRALAVSKLSPTLREQIEEGGMPSEEQIEAEARIQGVESGVVRSTIKGCINFMKQVEDLSDSPVVVDELGDGLVRLRQSSK